MKIIDCEWNKRNGNGQSTCHLCNTLTWDSWCYDFELKILDKELFNTILCGDCISKIEQEMKCKMSSKEEIIEEEKDIEELPLYVSDADLLKEVTMNRNKINEIVRKLKNLSNAEIKDI